MDVAALERLAAGVDVEADLRSLAPTDQVMLVRHLHSYEYLL